LPAQSESLKTIRLEELRAEFKSRNIDAEDVNLMAILFPSITNGN
jgi:hypothetical protein